MKKNSFLLSIVLMIILFAGCKKQENIDYSKLIQGTWMNTIVNGLEVLTDEIYVMEFKSDNTEMYAIGYQLDEDNKIWQENSSYTYSVKGDIVSITGNDLRGNTIQMKMKILSLSDDTLTFIVPIFSVNGELFPDDNVYTSNKIFDDYRNDFIGVWYGQCTTENNADQQYHYWEYFADGSFNYYYQDEENNWIKKSDNQGMYFLYGQLMVSNFSNDLLSGGTGLSYENWIFSIDGENMSWLGLRGDNEIVTYEMVKVASPPDVLD